MNAAIRAVTRSAIYNGMRVKGIYRGYKGLILDEIEEFKTQNVSNIIQRGGTILKTARCVEFKTPEGRKQAYDKLQEHGIDALIAIGGDGTLTGARIFAQEFNFPIVGLPGTIDNDLYGTDTTIGYDTGISPMTIHKALALYLSGSEMDATQLVHSAMKLLKDESNDLLYRISIGIELIDYMLQTGNIEQAEKLIDQLHGLLEELPDSMQEPYNTRIVAIRQAQN